MTSIDLYPYQEEALGKMKNGCILCGGVGSGKSRTGLAYYYVSMGGSLNGSPMKQPCNLYIITTARKRDTKEWESDLKPFGMSSVMGMNGYPKVTVDSWNNITKYTDITDSFFIFDEQRVVGYGAWTKSFLKITTKNKWILLSATPGDCWSDYIPVFIANHFYKNKTHFTTEHVVYKRFANYPIIDKYLNVGKLIKLRDSILVDMNYKTKAEQIHCDILCDYDKVSYKILLKERWDFEKDISIDTAARLCYELRKIVNSDESRKRNVLDIFSRHGRAIIFYSFDYELDILKSLDYGEDVEIKEWNGHVHEPTPSSKRWVYLVNFSAGAEGWNCITTNTMIFYSQQYSYKALIQACGRIDRLNTAYKQLYYYHLYSHSTIDISIRKALKSKKDFNAREFIKR